MTTWSRATFAQPCGRCAAVVAAGDALCTISGGGKWKLLRCVACAGEPVPADLPELEPRHVVAITSTRKPKRDAGWSSLPKDFKIAQGGGE